MASNDPHTGATGEAFPRVLFGYVLVGACALLAGIYLSGWYLATNPDAIGTLGTDHLMAGMVLFALATGMAVLESCEDYFGVTVSEWINTRLGTDSETATFEPIDPDDSGELVAVGEDDRGERVEIYLEEDDDE